MTWRRCSASCSTSPSADRLDRPAPGPQHAGAPPAHAGTGSLRGLMIRPPPVGQLRRRIGMHNHTPSDVTVGDGRARVVERASHLVWGDVCYGLRNTGTGSGALLGLVHLEALPQDPDSDEVQVRTTALAYSVRAAVQGEIRGLLRRGTLQVHRHEAVRARKLGLAPELPACDDPQEQAQCRWPLPNGPRLAGAGRQLHQPGRRRSTPGGARQQSHHDLRGAWIGLCR